MDTHSYHILTKNETPDIVKTLIECFANDPLYKKLLPNEENREKILADVFACDTSEMFNYCDMFADSKENKGLLILTDNTEKRSAFKKFWAEKLYAFKTELMLIKNDMSLKTLFRFFMAHKYLISKWTSRLKAEKHVHIIYFAVKKQYHGCGIAHKLMSPVFDYADKNGAIVTLETHNENNLGIYNHYGFEVHEQLKGPFGLTQFCLVRKPRSVNTCAAAPIMFGPVPPVVSVSTEQASLAVENIVERILNEVQQK